VRACDDSDQIAIPYSILMEDYDAAIHGASADESQQGSDDDKICGLEIPPQEGDELRAVAYSEHRGRLLHGRGTRHHGQHSLALSKKKSDSSATESQAHTSTNRPSRHLVREPGGKFDSFNTLPSSAGGADFVAKLVLYGE